MFIEQKLAQSALFGTTGVTRTLEFDLAKLVEEVGELAIEIQVTKGHLPKAKGGVDGVVGEAIDVINVSLDIIFLQMAANGITNSHQIEEMIQAISNKKLSRWAKKSKEIEAMQNV
ncbi:hypothetical protein AB4393_12270 [Vibrio splendidus]|uniref:hypothetical protein n=1 Tax=Vibrio splendidus TaxID=29497 RepID=UPI000C84B722|nr:hypothetical protein [Vibrio splendidus]PMH07608.1 hypothetical protein BCU75_17770 [Vibrio splendidus]